MTGIALPCSAASGVAMTAEIPTALMARKEKRNCGRISSMTNSIPASGAHLKAAADHRRTGNGAWPCSLGNRKISATILPRLPPICTEGLRPSTMPELRVQTPPKTSPATPATSVPGAGRPWPLQFPGYRTPARGKGMSEEIANQPQQGAETKAEQAKLPPGRWPAAGRHAAGPASERKTRTMAHQACQQADQGRQQEHQQRHLVPPYQALQDWRTTQRGRVGGRNGLLLHG